MTGGRTEPVVNAMSVDVEDYFHANVFDRVVDPGRWDRLESRVEANTRRLLAVLAEAGTRATFFVLGWVAERSPGLVREIAGGGHELASHGHRHRLVYQLSPEEFREDVRRAKGTVESIAGQAVRGYRAPSYSVTTRSLWAVDVLIEEGFEYDASIYPILHDRYGISDAPRHPFRLLSDAGSLVEVPGSTVRVGGMNLPIGGGGYFRLLPYRWTRWGIRRVNAREHRPVVFYVHPWELDPDQPRLPVARLSRVRHYGNLRRTEGRLRRLLAEFRFAPVAEVLDGRPLAAASLA